MSGKGYNYEFSMLLEGVEVPFKSANIICTPNGVEASINIHSNDKLFEIKPKTATQLFFKEWLPNEKGDAPSWRTLFDGFFSRFDKSDQAGGGRGVAILCRDFRMDIRKYPAALVYDDNSTLGRFHDVHTAGLYRTVTMPGTNIKGKLEGFSSGGTGRFGDPVAMIRRIAQAASRKPFKKVVTRGYDSYNFTYPTDKDRKDTDKKADGGFFLDAFARGIWLKTTGGSVHGKFLNKRIRADKRLFIPRNSAGYSMWSDQHLGKFVSGAIMGNSRFTSVEAAIMRVAGIFLSRVYSCNTPSIISLEDTINGKENPALKYVMSEHVRNYLVKDASAEFGEPYILNSSMLLPPLEFTAPPNCNLILPCMYDRVSWQYDQDVDITRGYFRQFHTFPSEKNPVLYGKNIQVPNTLFAPGNKPTMTIEERYKGINIMQGSVAYNLAKADASRALPNIVLRAHKAAEVWKEIDKYEDLVEQAKSAGISDAQIVDLLGEKKISQIEVQDIKNKVEQDKNKRNADKISKSKPKIGVSIDDAMKRHAIFKFLNAKYAGRVITIDMTFNPYIMAGFPGALLADDNADSYKTQKTMIGMVQQVKHLINVEGEASTTVVMNGVRFFDEPTDMDGDGNPYYSKRTDPKKAEINYDTLEYKEDYFVGDPAVHVEIIKDSKDIYDLRDTGKSKDYIYAKDVLSLSAYNLGKGERNARFVDDTYVPNRISKFYKEVFGQEYSFMVGRAVIERGGENIIIRYMYDTIHEALDNIIKNEKQLLNNYEKAMQFVKRNICSEEELFCSILGLSVQESKIVIDKDGRESVDIVYNLKKHKDILSSNHNIEYFGISTDAYKKLSNDVKIKLEELKEGDYSSIRESAPLTAFIKERKVAVKVYLEEVKKQAQGVIISHAN